MNLQTLFKTLAIPLLLSASEIIVAQQKVTALILVDAGTNADIRNLSLTDTIDPGTDGSSLTLRAVTDPGVVGSVIFQLDGVNVRTESVAPYAFAGDNSGDYNPMDLSPGDHVIRAIPFSESGGGGTEGEAMTVNLFIGDGDNYPGIPSGPASPPDDPGTGEVTVTGELMQWHKITLHVNGPECLETDTEPNPFLDLRLVAVFKRGDLELMVPGYFAGDGNAANSGSTGGNVWKVHFAPPETGTWTYRLSMRLGRNVAVSDNELEGEPLPPVDGAEGTLEISPGDKDGRDFRARGMLNYVGEHYLRFAGTGEYFLKQGADAPENFLAYQDFDGSFKNDGIRDHLIKDWSPHIQDWRAGDPTWSDGKGKGIIGAVNYLASEGMNAFSFLTMNIEGDDRNVFPYPEYTDRYHMDVSKLDQWEIVFEHGTRMGMYLHFKTQETENETLLDGGNLGIQRRLYYRELIARFSHHPALNWNLGEEINNQSLQQRKAMAAYFWNHDPYRHHIVIHNGSYPDDMLGDASFLTGFSLQTTEQDFSRVHGKVLEWVEKSDQAGKPWVVACDEPGDASHALVPDADDPEHDVARKNALWGTLMAGGAGNEWYFGYKHDHSDLSCEDFRSRDLWWDQCRIALEFFNNYAPFWNLKNHNDLCSAGYCFADPGETYVVYLKVGGNHTLSLEEGTYDLRWYDPRNGGTPVSGEVTSLTGPGEMSLGPPPAENSQDWVALVTRKKEEPILSDNADLMNLVPSSGSLEPPFDPGISEYSLLLPAGTLSVHIEASTADPGAAVTGSGMVDLSGGNVLVTIEVTAENLISSKIYTIQISTESMSAVPGKQEHISIYPNPAEEWVRISGIRSGDLITIVRPDGQVIGSFNAVSNDPVLDISEMKPGMYLLYVESGPAIQWIVN